MKAMLKRVVRRTLERGLRRYGYQLVNPNHRFGIDFMADVERLSSVWSIEVGTIFDVGANLGKTSIAFRSAWPRATIFAFEPNETVARQLQANAALTRSVSVYQVALSDRSGESPFYVHENSSDLNSLHEISPFVERFGLPTRAVDVKVTTIDEFCTDKSIGQIGVLKIDTEGSDYKVLLGARGLLSRHAIDFIYCEFNSLSSNPDRLGSLLPIANLLSRYEYNFIASYNDYITMEGQFFSVSNALFAADRGSRLDSHIAS